MDTSKRSFTACAIQDKAFNTITYILDTMANDFIKSMNPLNLLGFIQLHKQLEQQLPEALTHHRENTQHKNILPVLDMIMQSVHVKAAKVPNPSDN